MDINELYKIFTDCRMVTTDSRDCPKGSMFFALQGDSFNGNRFAGTALENGCRYAVIDESEYAEDNRYIVVENCLDTLKQLARYHRRQFNIPIIGITGTNGKTTTKELVAAVLAKKFNVLYTLGNFNNDIGVPKTLLRMNNSHEIAVIEMGASHPGDIKTLTETVEPDFGLITNVGMAHLQGFGSFEGVVRTKGELYDFLRKKTGSVVFIDAGNSHLTDMAENLQQVRYGNAHNGELYVEGEVVACDPLLQFRWRHGNSTWNDVQTHLIGTYNLNNMLAAASIGLYFGVSDKQINVALQNYIPSNNRSQLETTKHNKLIVDAYNANPTSMEAAIHNFKTMEVSPKMVIIGDMKELGEASENEHQKIADMLTTSGFENIWLVGEEFGKTVCNFRKFKDVEEVKNAIAQQQPNGYYILIKGSNSIKLAQLSAYL